jgi:deoxyribodipyrimidine photo-lyase
MRGLVWFREDLRIHDNTALYEAAQHCSAGIVAIYVLDIAMWQQHDIAACRVEFILRGLKNLSSDLAKRNIPLILLESTSQDLPKSLAAFMQQHQLSALFFNRQYEIDELRRDEAIAKHLTTQDLRCYSYDDQTILPPTSVTTQTGSYFKVFTPYKKAWQQRLQQQGGIALLPAPKAQTPIAIAANPIPDSINGFSSEVSATLWPAGEAAAQKRLNNFIANNLFFYDQQRDFPALQATSQLSPYLAAGMISARSCFMAALQANKGKLASGNAGALTWMSELIWREFYKYILVVTPRVSMHRAYQLQTEKLTWRHDEQQLLAWQQGRTGYPLIDAAMRQLHTTGWMHNRLRMVVAMFFSKNLFFDWRIGERYFMQHLIDGDLAANNGGWQWSASTGTDAAPYFRIFNPIRQSERFDPEGKFIRRYCPELAHLDNKKIHDPSHYLSATELASYCQPIVDLETSRQAAIAAFKKLNETSQY